MVHKLSTLVNVKPHVNMHLPPRMAGAKNIYVELCVQETKNALRPGTIEVENDLGISAVPIKY